MSKSKAFFLLGFSLTLLGLVILVRLFVNLESPISPAEWRAIVVQWLAAATACLGSLSAYVFSWLLRPKKS